MAYLTYKDYNSFLDLGPGGTPYNFYGYLTITLLRIVALRNPRVAGPVPDHMRHTGYLSKTEALPKRKVPRPDVVGIAPHRQTNQKPSAFMFSRLSEEIRGLADNNPERLRMGISCFEKHCPGLFSNRQLNKTCNGEICHAHPSDGSMHLTLHPEDAEKVIQAGFGERHPLVSHILVVFRLSFFVLCLVIFSHFCTLPPMVTIQIEHVVRRCRRRNVPPRFRYAGRQFHKILTRMFRNFLVRLV